MDVTQVWDSPRNGDRPVATSGTVHVVGTGLLGASVGLGLATRGVDVTLYDTSPTALILAEQVGAGRPVGPGDGEPDLVVVAAPPDVTGRVVLEELARHPDAVVTDLASVKSEILTEVRAGGGDTARYVGSHPMAGRERSGPIAAQADLFFGRPWVITPGPDCSDRAHLVVRDLATDLGAVTSTMAPADHDRAVALVSHLPQLVASLVAARLVDAEPATLALAGQGLRDVTRIAASDPTLWAAILAANTDRVLPLLRDLREDLDALVTGLEGGAGYDGAHPGPGPGVQSLSPHRAGPGLTAVASLVGRGNAGVARVPGKHGGAHRDWAVLTVLVPDRPGELGRLFAEVGAVGVNMEDMSMEHSPGQPVGLVDLSVIPGRAEELARELTARGWRVVAR